MRSVSSLIRSIAGRLERIDISCVHHDGRRTRPSQIQIETSSRCNLSCRCCSYSLEADHGEFLTVEALAAILDRLPFHPEYVTLSGIGEPLLNPSLFPLVDLLAEQGCRCGFYTNGTLLTPTITSGILKRPSITHMAITCDGATKETFERSRVGAVFETWRERVDRFTAEAARLRPDLHVSMFTLVDRDNAPQLDSIIRMAAELRFQHVNLLGAMPVHGVAESLAVSAAGLGRGTLDRLSKLAGSFGMGLSDVHMQRQKLPPRSLVRCLYPWQYVFVRANGNVQPCCAVFGADKAAVMGNLFETGFDDIWNGEGYREFRHTSATGTNSLCRTCPMY